MSDQTLTPSPDPAFVDAVLSVAPRLICVLDAAGVVKWARGNSRNMVGIPASDLVGRNLLDFVPDIDLPLARESMEYAINSTSDFKPMEFRYRRADGSFGVAEAVSTNHLADPRINGIVLQVHDVTDRVVNDQILEAIAQGGHLTTMLRLVARLVESRVPDCRAIVAIDPLDGRFEVAASALDSLGAINVRDETYEPDPIELSDHGHGPTGAAEGSPSSEPDAVAGGGGVQGAGRESPLPWTAVIEDGRARFHAALDALPLSLQEEARLQGFSACWLFPVFLAASGEVVGCIIVWREVPGDPSPGERVAVEKACRLVSIALERRDSQELLEHAARHDTLTGLPNRALFFDRLGRELQRAEQPVAVLYVDLDGFKTTNDRYGHRAGDHVLVAVARRIADALRPGDLVARLGGDEFGIICPRLSDPHEAEQIADRLIGAVSQPVSLPPATIRSPELSVLAGAPTRPDPDSRQPTMVAIGASIGIAFGGDAHADPERLLELADAAMYNAKRRGRGTWRRSGPSGADGPDRPPPPI